MLRKQESDYFSSCVLPEKAMVSFSPFFLQTDRWKWKIARRGFFILSGFAIAFFLNRALERHDFYASFLVDLLPAFFNHQFSEPLGLFLSLSTVHQVPYPPATIPNEQDIFLVICHRGPRLPLFTNGGNGLNINNRPHKELYSKSRRENQQCCRIVMKSAKALFVCCGLETFWRTLESSEVAQ